MLLDELDSPHPGLRQAALGALQQISGLHLAEALEPWREWHARESEWQTTGRQAAQQALASGEDARVAQALGAYAEHRLFRSQLAEDVLQVFEHESSAMRVMACATLARIGSLRALAPLIDHFADEDAQFAEAAWRAACSLSGKTLPRTSAEAREQVANS